MMRCAVVSVVVHVWRRLPVVVPVRVGLRVQRRCGLAVFVLAVSLLAAVVVLALVARLIEGEAERVAEAAADDLGVLNAGERLNRRH